MHVLMRWLVVMFWLAAGASAFGQDGGGVQEVSGRAPAPAVDPVGIWEAGEAPRSERLLWVRTWAEAPQLEVAQLLVIGELDGYVTAPRARGRGPGRPQAGVAFEISVWSQGSATARKVTFAGETGEDGGLLLELGESLWPSDARGPSFSAEVTQNGFQRRMNAGQFVRKANGTREIWLMAHPGRSLVGTVQDQAGRPIEGSCLFRSEAGGPVQDLRPRSSWIGRERGQVLVHLDPGQGGQLWAATDDAGAGMLEVPASAAEDGLVLVVGGEGLLRGKVLDAAGRPSPRMQLLVTMAELDRVHRGRPLDLEATMNHAGLGLVSDFVEVGPDGSFEARGLRSGRYVVRARYPGRGPGFPAVLTPEPGESEGALLALRFENTSFSVRVLDAEGLALGEVRSAHGDWQGLELPRLMVFRCEGQGADRRALGPALQPSRTGPGVHHFDGLRGEFLAGVIGGGFDGRLQLLQCEPGSSRVTITVRAPRDLVLGRLDAKLAASIEGAAGRVRVSVLDPGSGAVLLRSGLLGGQQELSFELPVGTYRLVAEGEADIEDWHGTLVTPRRLGRFECEVQVTANGGPVQHLPLGAGCRLDLQLLGELSEADRAATLEQKPWLRSPKSKGSVDAACRALLWIEDARGRREPVLRTEVWDFSSAAGLHVVPEWLLGSRQVAEVLPAGDFLLIARLPGGRELRQPLSLQPDRPVELVLRF